MQMKFLLFREVMFDFFLETCCDSFRKIKKSIQMFKQGKLPTLPVVSMEKLTNGIENCIRRVKRNREKKAAASAQPDIPAQSAQPDVPAEVVVVPAPSPAPLPVVMPAPIVASEDLSPDIFGIRRYLYKMYAKAV